MGKERDDIPSPQELQTVVERIKAVQQAKADKEQSQREALEAIPRLRERLYGLIRHHVEPYQVPDYYASYKKIYKNGCVVLVDDPDDYDPNEYRVPEVHLNFDTFPESESSPVIITIAASAHPGIEEPHTQEGSVQVVLGGLREYGIPSYYFTSTGAVAEDVNRITSINQDGTAVTRNLYTTRPLEMSDVVNIGGMIALAEDTNTQVDVAEPYQLTS